MEEASCGGGGRREGEEREGKDAYRRSDKQTVQKKTAIVLYLGWLNGFIRVARGMTLMQGATESLRTCIG